MVLKTLSVDEKYHTLLKLRATGNKRSIRDEVDDIFEKEFGEDEE